MTRSWWLLSAAVLCWACESSEVSSGGAGGATGASTSNVGGASSTSSAGGSPGCVPVGAPVADDCITDVAAADAHVFSCDGLSYTVSVPATCTSCACGLVFDVHGYTMSAVMEEANTRLAELGRQHGYIVVQPSAAGSPPGWTAAVDDPKVYDFMQRTIAAFHVDVERVHFTGFSQGGDMTWRFLCDHSDVLASVAPGAFGNGNDQCFSQGTAPANTRPILYLHGTADALVAFSTAESSRDAVIAAQSMSETAVVESDATHVWTRYESSAGALFEFLQHDYQGASLLGGHCYPGSTDPGGAPGQIFSFACDPPNAFVWGEAVMSFFMAHPRR